MIGPKMSGFNIKASDDEIRIKVPHGMSSDSISGPVDFEKDKDAAADEDSFKTDEDSMETDSNFGEESSESEESKFDMHHGSSYSVVDSFKTSIISVSKKPDESFETGECKSASSISAISKKFSTIE